MRDTLNKFNVKPKISNNNPDKKMIPTESRLKNPLALSPQMAPLIKLGIKGQFPLFYPNWIAQSLSASSTLKIKKIERKKIHEISKKISKHKNIERQRTFLLSLSQEDRNLFVRAFLNMVENRVTSQEVNLQ